MNKKLEFGPVISSPTPPLISVLYPIPKYNYHCSNTFIDPGFVSAAFVGFLTLIGSIVMYNLFWTKVAFV